MQLATIPIGEAASASSASSARLGAAAEDDEDPTASDVYNNSDCSSAKRGMGLYDFAPLLNGVIGSGTYLSRDIFALCEGGGACEPSDASTAHGLPDVCVSSGAERTVRVAVAPPRRRRPASPPPAASHPPARA